MVGLSKKEKGSAAAVPRVPSMPGIAVGLLAAASLALSPLQGYAVEQVSTDGLDTETKRAGNQGANALIEGSDITDESVESILDKLKNKVLPESKAMIAKASDDGSTYTASLAKEIELVEQEVEGQIQAIKEGKASSSNLKSFLSGVEQQLNALKANGGFD
ncbi:hypothetical protein CVIRNUC_007887 [Coccomyxa viridis]|uniref:Uncharacterized protein n=1 Tax=Coccomyxa viridis TaxID=1274662 RepID=A0AAV1IBF9_9CHLO|nr:hypothetical protein CVIRNUC_007887 [Coccomyxa viridis]